MKKIILFLLLLTSLYSDAKIYIGTGGGYLEESFSNSSFKTNSAETAKFKIGYGIREAYAIEFSFNYLKNDSNNFSADDSDKFGLNVELIKAFDWDIFINPYFKGGFGAGYFKIDNTTKSSLSYGSYNLGLGFFIPINEHFDFEIGYDYKYLSYEKLNKATTSEDISSNMHGTYLGFNVRF